MALTDNQLLLLDNLIYTEYCVSDDGESITVEQIIQKMKEDLDDGISITALDEYLTDDDWRAIITAIENQPELLSYTVTYYVDDPETSMRAACFVDDVDNPTDVNVIFRGTASNTYEWHDNGEGAYLSDTASQIEAAEYINNLPESYGNNITVSGHSKGGNRAQYVTIVTDRIGRCVSFDGQGFSQEFMDKYAEEIAEKAGLIISISASLDYVNCLLYPIAGTQIYIETEEMENFLHYHRPDILLDEYGNLRPVTEQSDFLKFINEYSIYLISDLDEPERSYVIDGLIDIVVFFLEVGESREGFLANINALIDAGSHLDDFILNYIGEKYGFLAEYVVTIYAAFAFPFLFLDDLINLKDEAVDTVMSWIMDLAGEVKKKLESFGEAGVSIASKFIDAMSNFVSSIQEIFNNHDNDTSYSYHIVDTSTKAASSYFRVDTDALRECANRLTNVRKRVVALKSSMKALYSKTGWIDLKKIINDDDLTKYLDYIDDCIDWLNTTADDFELAERSIAYQF